MLVLRRPVEPAIKSRHPATYRLFSALLPEADIAISVDPWELRNGRWIRKSDVMEEAGRWLTRACMRYATALLRGPAAERL